MRNFDCKIHLGGGAIKKVLNTKNGIDLCTTPEYTNDYLVEGFTRVRRRCAVVTRTVL